MSTKKNGALSTSPSAQAQQKKTPSDLGLTRVSPGIYRNPQGQRVNSRGQALGGPRRSGGNQQGGNQPPAGQGSPAKPGFNDITQSGYNALAAQLGQMGGQFAPGSFAEQQQNAYNNVMNRFNLTNQEVFNDQMAAFEQQAAERGLDPQGEAYQKLKSNLIREQERARQGAMLEANQAANDLQKQYFEQQAIQHQMPGQMMQYLQPMYQFGTEQQLLAQKGALEKQIAAMNAAASVRAAGMGALNFDQRKALQENEMMGNYLLSSGQPIGQNPSWGTAIGQGAIAAAPSIIGSIMGRKQQG